MRCLRPGLTKPTLRTCPSQDLGRCYEHACSRRFLHTFSTRLTYFVRFLDLQSSQLLISCDLTVASTPKGS